MDSYHLTNVSGFSQFSLKICIHEHTMCTERIQTLTLTDSITSFCIQKKEAIDLEVKLNVSHYGKKWSIIGDYLYAFGIYTYPDTTLVISTEQMRILNVLHKRISWRDCYDV